MFAARTGLQRVSFAGWLWAGVRCANGAERRFRSPAGCGLGVRCANGAERRFRSPAGCGYALSGFRPPGPGFAARTGWERFRSPAGCGSFSFAAAGDRQGGASRRAPLTPGSGLLHRRFAVPSPLPDFSRTVGTRHPWHDPDSSRPPCRSSGNPSSAQRFRWPP